MRYRLLGRTGLFVSEICLGTMTWVDRERASRCVDAMRPIAQAHDVSVARVALAWTLQQPGITSAARGPTVPSAAGDNPPARRVHSQARFHHLSRFCNGR